MKENQEFSFAQLISLTGSDQEEYARWFGERAVLFAQAAAGKIRHIASFHTEAGQSEAWGDRFNPEYELRRAAATLIGLEEKLDETLEQLRDLPGNGSTQQAVEDAIEHALDDVRRSMQEVKDDFSRANGWFVAVDSLFTGSLLD